MPQILPFKTCTFGCKVNQYETEYVRQSLLSSGLYRTAQSGEPAELVIVNTCTVTAQSDYKCRKGIRKLAKENPGAKIVVMGCLAAREPNDMAKLEGVTEILTDKRDIPSFLGRCGMTTLPTGISTFSGRHRAFVKIQDGCDAGCSYCVIPQVRPQMWSRPVPEILTEIRNLVQNGYREVILTGIHLGRFGSGQTHSRNVNKRMFLAPSVSAGLDRDNPNLVTLLRAILSMAEEVEHPFRIRLSSIEAVEVSLPLLEWMAENPSKLCGHLHLPMQSGSNSVLTRMNRRQQAEPFLNCCQTVRKYLPDIALTTDVMVGFPGETDIEFEETCQLIQTIGFSKLHVFRYSPRPNTVAATLSGRVPIAVQTERAQTLQKLSDQQRRSFAESRLGKTVQILVERKIPHTNTSVMTKTVVAGTTDCYLDAEMIPTNTDTADSTHSVESTNAITAKIGTLQEGVVRTVSGTTLLYEGVVSTLCPPF